MRSRVAYCTIMNSMHSYHGDTPEKHLRKEDTSLKFRSWPEGFPKNEEFSLEGCIDIRVK